MKISSLEEFKKVLKEKGISYKDANKGYLYIRCSSCDVDNQRKMKRYIHYNQSSSNCFICQERQWLSDILKEPLIEVDGSIPIEEIKEKEHPQAKELPVVSAIPVNQLPIGHPALKFLNKDHIYDLDALWNKFRITYIEEGVPLEFPKGTIDPKDSLLFPVIANGELVGWQLRFIPGTKNGDKWIAKKRKYLHLYSKSHYVYNGDEAKKSDFVVVVEGVKKAWKYPKATIATMGKDISGRQLRYIFENWKKVMFMMDAGEGQKKVDEYIYAAGQAQVSAIAVDPNEYGFKSPDEMTCKQMETIVEANKNYLGL